MNQHVTSCLNGNRLPQQREPSSLNVVRLLIESVRTNLDEIDHAIKDAVDLHDQGRVRLRDDVNTARFVLERMAVNACAIDNGVIPGALRGGVDASGKAF